MVSQGAFIRIAVGFIYPAYKSLEAMMTKDCEDDMIMLRYWVVLAALSLVETIADPLFDFLPGYLLGKCIFLLWCMMPGDKNGADLIFSKVIYIYTIVIFIFVFISDITSTLQRIPSKLRPADSIHSQ